MQRIVRFSNRTEPNLMSTVQFEKLTENKKKFKRT